MYLPTMYNACTENMHDLFLKMEYVQNLPVWRHIKYCLQIKIYIYIIFGLDCFR